MPLLHIIAAFVRFFGNVEGYLIQLVRPIPVKDYIFRGRASVRKSIAQIKAGRISVQKAAPGSPEPRIVVGPHAPPPI